MCPPAPFIEELIDVRNDPNMRVFDFDINEHVVENAPGVRLVHLNAYRERRPDGAEQQAQGVQRVAPPGQPRLRRRYSEPNLRAQRLLNEPTFYERHRPVICVLCLLVGALIALSVGEQDREAVDGNFKDMIASSVIPLYITSQIFIVARMLRNRRH
ncbi:unnamed protein product [Caenorhabditis auriculariae]|uniref:Uncharacterized protein n=1 Tax=Caenorhabditis auriculariae TaxID=2777116 RepID=A0A8S1H8K1_9PELO|nr:unnamed protein product [Caenorhabditis auriculariae]